MQYSLLELSWEVHVALVSGYAAYLVGFTGIRFHHTKLDVAFITLLFALVATGILSLKDKVGASYSAVLAITVTIICAIFWRKLGRSWWRWLLRKTDVSWSSDDPSAWATLNAESKYFVSQVSVLTDDGDWLECRDTGQFSDSPFGPCQFGPNGDIALYLTHQESCDGNSTSLGTVKSEEFGDRITYVPANRIKRIAIRYLAE